MKKCVFAGTFDPFTVGHEDTVSKCLKLFDEVIVAVAVNKSKACMFTPEERLEMVKSVYQKEPRVRVLIWEGVIADLLEAEDAPFYVRGIRNLPTKLLIFTPAASLAARLFPYICLLSKSCFT